MTQQGRHKLTLGLASFTAVVGLTLLMASVSAAHPNLRAHESSPGPGALLSTSPSEIRLVFSVEPGGLIPEQSIFWVVKEQGRSVVAVGTVDLNAPDRDAMVAVLPSLERGIYSVKWVAISRSDQGFSEGSFSFAVTGQ
jgi:methionine-rich copper-binding protein CopC